MASVGVKRIDGIEHHKPGHSVLDERLAEQAGNAAIVAP